MTFKDYDTNAVVDMTSFTISMIPSATYIVSGSKNTYIATNKDPETSGARCIRY